jgi:threonine dehydrogenase-like Zn-dependent dehydrogenase
MLCDARPWPGVSEFQGAFAEYVRVHESQLLRIPAGLGTREAALAEPLAVALHGIARSGVEPGRRVLVTGAGSIGLLTLAALRARGVEDVTVSEPSPGRRQRALALGATRALEPDALDVPRMPFAVPDAAVDVAFECSGRGSAFEAALAQLRPGGRLVLQGTGAERPRLDAHRVLLNELVVTGAYCYDEGGVGAALELLASGALPTAGLLYPEDVPLEGLQGAIERLAHGRVAGKVLVAPR